MDPVVQPEWWVRTASMLHKLHATHPRTDSRVYNNLDRVESVKFDGFAVFRDGIGAVGVGFAGTEFENRSRVTPLIGAGLCLTPAFSQMTAVPQSILARTIIPENRFQNRFHD